MPKLNLVVAVHGILTGRTNPTWPERFEQWLSSRSCGVTVLTDHYEAGPFPWWNVWIKNRRAALSLDNVVENYIDGLPPGEVTVHFVGHSNGCDIIRRSAMRLMRRGYDVASIMMFSAPCCRSVEGMGLQDFIDNGQLERLTVYSADDDDVLSPMLDWKRPWTVIRNVLQWPYGNAGRYGLSDGDETVMRSGAMLNGHAVTRHFPGWGHGDFFPLSNPGRMAGTFEMIVRDSGLQLHNHESA